MRARTLAPAVAIAIAVAIACSTPGCAGGAPCAEDYGGCGGGEPCAEGASCETLAWRDGRGEICWRGCDDELDCPREGGRGGRCVDAARDGRFACYRDCAADDECPSGWVCQPIRVAGGGGGAICLP